MLAYSDFLRGPDGRSFGAMTSLRRNVQAGRACLCGLFAVAAALAVAGPAGAAGITERVSIASDGTQGNGASIEAAISADGRYVAFQSPASNLVAFDTNSLSDIFVRDRQTGTTERVSVATDGTQANGLSEQTEISADGRYVAFKSFASNLVAGDTNGTADVFVRDLVDDTTERVSVGTAGGQSSGLSEQPAISGDGRYVAFQSFGSNLVAGDTNGLEDIFVRDRDRPAPLSGSASAPSAARRAAPASTRRSAPTAATSPGSQAHRTWWSATPTASRTSSSTTA